MSETTAPAPRPVSDWGREMRVRLAVTDVVSIVVAVAGSQLLWFGLRNTALAADGRALEGAVPYTLFSVNWSLVGDLLLIWRTLRAVVRKEGAY